MTRVPPPPFRHLLRLTDHRGLFEHAEGSTPRVEHGYCLDDVARALVVVCRQRPSTALHASLARRYLGFVVGAQAGDGRFHNRLSPAGRWQDEPGTGDWWGRALLGLGTAAARGPVGRRTARRHFVIGARTRSPDARAMASAALGAAELLSATPADRTALALLEDAVSTIGRPSPDPAWRWPEPRLAYGNATLAEAMIAAGHHLDDATVLADGLAMLTWLVELETTQDHLSVVGVGGWAVNEPRPAFDQQPIEVAAIADAAYRAYILTGQSVWCRTVERAAAWFLGHNDTGTALYDPTTGGGRDAVTPSGCNTNQGAESTLALISTLQQARRLSIAQCGARVGTG